MNYDNKNLITMAGSPKKAASRPASPIKVQGKDERKQLLRSQNGEDLERRAMESTFSKF